jgi:hypothetical protein
MDRVPQETFSPSAPGGLRPSARRLRLSARQFRLRVSLVFGLGVAGLVFAYSPLLKHFLKNPGQSPSYHHFPDQRTFLGIPHCLNVVSNLPITGAGLLGLWFLFRRRAKGARPAFLDDRERWPFVVFFLGMALTGFGSAYYHWHPDNGRMVWDRLPMTLVFIALFAATVAERVSVKLGTELLWPLAALGIASVLYWDWTERHGAGDLRPYGLVQVYPFVAVALLLLLLPPRYTGTGYVWGALGWFCLVKVLDIPRLDQGIYALGHLVCGHTLHHLAGAVGACWLLRGLTVRRPVSLGASGVAPGARLC